MAVEAKEADEYLVAIPRKIDGRYEDVRHAIFTTDVWWHGIHEELDPQIEIFD